MKDLQQFIEKSKQQGFYIIILQYINLFRFYKHGPNKLYSIQTIKKKWNYQSCDSIQTIHHICCIQCSHSIIGMCSCSEYQIIKL